MAGQVTATTRATSSMTPPTKATGDKPAAGSRPVKPVAKSPDTVKAASLQTDHVATRKVGIAPLPESIVAAWDTERVDETAYRESLLPDVHLDLEQVGGTWEAFPAFLKTLKALQSDDPEHRHVTLILNVHGNNGTGIKVVAYRHEDAAAPGDTGAPAKPVDAAKATHVDVSIASAAQINVWLKEAGFAPEDVTIVSELCNGGNAYLVSVDGFNATERTAAIHQATKLAGKEHVAVGSVAFLDPSKPTVDLTYRWIGRKSGGNTAGTVFLQAATGMGTGVTGEVSAAPLVDLNRLGKPGKVKVAVTGERNPWPDDHFNEMIAALRDKAPRFFDKVAEPKAGDNP